MAISSHLNWLIVRNTNAFLLRKRDIKKPFSTEPNNLTIASSYSGIIAISYSGIVYKKTLGVVPAVDKKDFTVVMKSTCKETMKAGPRRSEKLRNLFTDNIYRKHLRRAHISLDKSMAVDDTHPGT
ncbi:large ribosomal subunit protein eL28-like [Musca vetustissima]|uniref:large ribosomal subunit protein eL28-like n=1 Tax=Musca vetustissima TaxID=27455 RepID=UPI002AB7F20F|nr:large ribosomal subunit protein eL28-like [Musca vetustissima]